MEILNQAKNLIEKSQDILVLPSPELQGDNLGSALALFFTLKKLGKNVNISTEKIPEKFQFLANFCPASAQDFAVSINTSGKEISRMHYEKNDGDLKIYFTLGRGELTKEDFVFLPPAATNKNPGLLIVLGAKSLEIFNDFSSQNIQLFNNTPILNLDNQINNENFGEVNLIEITSSLAEIAMNLINWLGPGDELLDENIASNLLTGIIWASQNFRNPRIRPKTFENSAFLIKKGAKHQEIIHHLYKQKNVCQIKLLGKILEKINFSQEKELYLASLTENDFQNCGASSKDLAFVIEELKFNFRFLPNLLILWESHASPSLVKGFFYSPRLDLGAKILENFEGVSKKGGVLFLVREANLVLSQEKVLEILT